MNTSLWRDREFADAAALQAGGSDRRRDDLPARCRIVKGGGWSLLLYSAALLISHGSLAWSSPGLNFAWNECGSAGVSAVCFACNTNAGTVDMVGSYVAPAGVTQLTGNDVVVDIVSESPTLPEWWHLVHPGWCRQAAVTADFTPPPDTESLCRDQFGGPLPAGGIAAYRTNWTANPTPTPNRARLVLAFGVWAPEAPPLEADVEYLSFRLRLNFTRSSGDSACAGCATPVTLVLNRINLTQPVGVGDITVSDPADNRTITWNPSHGGCYVSARNRTWGAIKSLYR